MELGLPFPDLGRRRPLGRHRTRVGPHPDPLGSVVHVVAIRGNTRLGQPVNPKWIEAGYRYKPVGWPEGGCDCWATFYATNAWPGHPPDAFDLGPAAPWSTHKFQFASNDLGGWEVWVDGILRTVLPLGPDAWTDWAEVAQTEVHHHMETTDARFDWENFFHSPFRQWPEGIIEPFLIHCHTENRMPYRPGVDFDVFIRSHRRHGPSTFPVCNEHFP